MSIDDLYKKERNYQRSIFGDCQNESFNVASYLQFIEEYLEKAKHDYASKWGKNKPGWLINCKEFNSQETAPIKTYEHLIKVFTLSGAALELFCNIDVDQWRSQGPKEKWEK